MEDNMKYISIILISLFLIGAYYSINSSTMWKKGKIILQSNTQDIVALTEYNDCGTNLINKLLVLQPRLLLAPIHLLT